MDARPESCECSEIAGRGNAPDAPMPVLTYGPHRADENPGPAVERRLCELLGSNPYARACRLANGPLTGRRTAVPAVTV